MEVYILSNNGEVVMVFDAMWKATEYLYSKYKDCEVESSIESVNYCAYKVKTKENNILLFIIEVFEVC